MKILFLAPYPPGEAPSQRFRFEHFFKYLPTYGYQYSFQPFWSLPAWLILYKSGHYLRKAFYLLQGYLRRLSLLIDIHKYDIVFVHREITPLGPPIFEYIFSQLFHKNLVYDFDDAIWLHNTSSVNSMVAWLKQHHKTDKICKWSHKVSAGNLFLANHARAVNQNVEILPTMVDTEYHHCKVKQHYDKKTITIGWTGTHSTSTYLQMVVPVVRQLSEKYNLVLHVISNQPPEIDLNNVTFTLWSKEKEIDQLLQFDIGLMPLYNSDWERGKCGFKVIQYMALGIPCVASPVGVNSSLISNKENGFLAYDTPQWRDYLAHLIENPSLRSKTGSKGRETVIQNYSVLALKARFFSLFA